MGWLLSEPLCLDVATLDLLADHGHCGGEVPQEEDEEAEAAHRHLSGGDTVGTETKRHASQRQERRVELLIAVSRVKLALDLKNLPRLPCRFAPARRTTPQQVSPDRPARSGAPPPASPWPV